MFFCFIGTTEIVVILAIALLVFGPTKLPEIGRQIGSAMREMRRMSNEVQRALEIDDYPRYSSYESNSTSSTYDYSTESSAWSGEPDYANPESQTEEVTASTPAGTVASTGQDTYEDASMTHDTSYEYGTGSVTETEQIGNEDRSAVAEAADAGHDAAAPDSPQEKREA